MIIDLPKFVAAEQPFWRELDEALTRLEEQPTRELELPAARRVHYLYERASADLVKLKTFTAEPETRRYLEALVARAYAEIHEQRERPHRLRPVHWFIVVFPQTFRRQAWAFGLAGIVMAAGSLFGGWALAVDGEAKAALMPFSHLRSDPSRRVEREERAANDAQAGEQSAFAAYLMTHNTKVSIFTLALGVTWGLGTVILLFYNGVILGAVAVDYVLAGETTFLLGWLLPHGSVEIPAILIAGQAGLVLGRALIGWGDRTPLAQRLRAIGGDMVTFIGGVAVLLVWAGIVEAFFSQYHAPVVPYAVKIVLGAAQLVLLAAFLAGSGRTKPA